MQRRHFIKSAFTLGSAVALPSAFYRSGFAANLPAAITEFTATQLSAAILQRSVSCHEVMQSYLAHIHRHNPVYNAIVSLVADDVLFAQAKDADLALTRGEYRGWMHGMPHAVKDLSAVAGMRFTNGSALYADRIAETDSELAAKIRRAGAIFIGKTNSPEFGLGSQTYNPVFGSTASAWNPALTSGGSSGGAGSGLGTQMLPVADGSDMMGSLRNPGAFNNVIGFRPSTNVMTNSDAASRGLSVSGPMGRNTTDTIQFLETIAVHPIGTDMSPLQLRNLKLGWLGNFDNYLAMEPGILPLCETALGSLATSGSTVEAVQPNFSLTDLWQCWTTLRHSGRASMQSLYNDATTREKMKPELIWEIEESMRITEQEIAAANRIRAAWYLELDRLFAEYDFLILPTAQVFPYPKENPWPQEINGRKMDTYHRWMEVVISGSLGGIPVINVPVGFDPQGRPMGMQVMGKFGDDRRVLEFALAYETITDHLQQRPQLQAAQ